MDKEQQALAVVKQICEQVSLPLAGHQQVQEALNILAEAIKPVVETSGEEK